MSELRRLSRQLKSLWHTEGANGIALRARARVARAVAPADAPLEVFRNDVLALGASRVPHSILDIAANEPPSLNWIITPAGPGSGGHTTAYRIINFLERQGFRNRVFFYDVYGGDPEHYADVARTYYRFEGPIGAVSDGMPDAHGVFATSWQTAYPAMASRCAGKRFYFVQDYEPYFYPVGSSSVLAENTYRMGFHGVTAGVWLASKLKAEFQMDAEHFDFGCDTKVYRRDSASHRDGIVFYARPGAARRGFELGLMAIEALSRRRPELTIHLYGQKAGRLAFPFVDHGAVTPSQLNAIYNRCYAGLSLSLTNVSLVPHEMLAAGCIPVVNDAAHNRMVLDNDFVRYATPDPQALALELDSIAAMPSFDSHSAAAAASVRSTDWDDAGKQVEAILRRALTAQAEARTVPAHAPGSPP